MTVIPSKVLAGTKFTVQSGQEPFTENVYIIKNQSGKIIRKGSISKGNSEFYLSVAGMATGVYRIEIGLRQDSFTVI